MRRLAMYALAACSVALLVWLAGVGLSEDGARPSLEFGVLLALAVQLAWAVPLARAPLRHRFLVYGAGMFARFGVFAAAALLLVPRLDLAAPEALLSLVAVFFGTTLLEPLLFSGGALTNAEATE